MPPFNKAIINKYFLSTLLMSQILLISLLSIPKLLFSMNPRMTRYLFLYRTPEIYMCVCRCIFKVKLFIFLEMYLNCEVLVVFKDFQVEQFSNKSFKYKTKLADPFVWGEMDCKTNEWHLAVSKDEFYNFVISHC